jgi:hypothetical protein
MNGDVTIRKLENAELTVKVYLSRGFRFRIAIGVWLMKLGARILPLPAKVETKGLSDGAPEVGIPGGE